MISNNKPPIFISTQLPHIINTIFARRAIGDVALQPYVTCEPEILEKDIGAEDEYLVLASDGVWDVMRNEEVARFIGGKKGEFLNLAKDLCSEALLLGSQDNVTALVIDLRFVLCHFSPINALNLTNLTFCVCFYLFYFLGIILFLLLKVMETEMEIKEESAVVTVTEDEPHILYPLHYSSI